MALVAIHAVVDISADISMVGVGVSFGVAVRALKNAVVTCVGMAGGAYPVGIAVVYVEPGVIENSAQPTGRGMAGGAGRGETSGDVVRVIGSLVFGFVTAVAVGRKGCVVVVHVTVCASHARVRTSQRERCVVVIERGRGPGGRVVTDVALLREPDRNVIRIGRTLEVFEVTPNASGAGQVVVAVRMALGALQIGVRSGEREAGRRMIERGGSPIGGAVADLALLREARRDMVRVSGALVIL